MMRHIGPMDYDHSTDRYESEDKRFLARSYVLCQKFERVYNPHDALRSGTAFEDLDKPDFNWKP